MIRPLQMISRDFVPMSSYEDRPARVDKLSIVGGLERPNTTTPRVVENRTAMRILRAARLRL